LDWATNASKVRAASGLHCQFVEKLNPKAAAQPHILDDDSCAIQLTDGMLTTGARLRFAANGKDALRRAAESVPEDASRCWGTSTLTAPGNCH
jgi:hypothetical protein